MNVIIGCECSQAICIEFRKRGHEAFSCDLKDCTGGHPEWHIKGDLLNHLNDGFDLGIIHPPCYDLAVSGAAWFKKKQETGQQQQSVDFFMKCANAPIKKLCLENPIGIMSSLYRKPDQIINPSCFGDPVRKPTCLWLTNLPKLVWLKQDDLFGKKTSVEPELITMTSKKTGRTRTYSKWEYEASCNQKERSTIRSVTFNGIAVAMAEQWNF
jgi:hypothetical protein